MYGTLCATVVALALVCVGCGRGVGDQPAAEATPAATSGTGQQQPAASQDVAKEGFDAGDSGTLEPNQGADSGTTPEAGS